MKKLLLASLVGAFVWILGPSIAGPSRAHAQRTLAYWGNNLFDGLAYHRFGCVLDKPNAYPWTQTVQTNNTYQGFSGTQQCYAGTTSAHMNNDHHYLDQIWWGDQSDAGLTQDYCWANHDYDLRLYYWWYGYKYWNYCFAWTPYGGYSTSYVGSSSSSCSYNVLTNCNSDCWIRNFSQRQGHQIGISSPCW